MGEFGEGKGDQTRESWEKYPVSTRLYRMETLADLSLRLRAYMFGGVDDLASAENVASTKRLLVEMRKDEIYMPIGVQAVLERYEALLDGAGQRTAEAEKAAEAVLRSLAEMIDGEYTGVLAGAKTASQEDIRQGDILAVTDVRATARRDLNALRERITVDPRWLQSYSWNLELRRQRLVADGLRYERAHPEERGETAKANAPWLLLENALLASDRNKMDDVAKKTLLDRIEACKELVDLVESWEE